MSYLNNQDKCGIEIDDTVLIYRECPDYYRGWRGYFNCTCMECLNHVGKVIDIVSEYGIYVSVPKNGYDIGAYFPYFALKKVHPMYNQSKKFKKFENVVRRQERKVLNRLTRA